MALKAGRVGVNPNYVDKEGRPLYDNSYLKELLRKEGIITLFTKEGNPISIDNAVEGHAYDLTAVMLPIQAGTGTPSPDNVRAISGHDSIAITVNGVAVTVTFEDTVYGGILDVTTGRVVVTHTLIDLGSLTWLKSGTSANSFYAVVTPYALGNIEMVCSAYEFTGAATTGFYEDKKIKCWLRTNSDMPSEVYVKDTTYDDAAEFKTGVAGVKLAIPLYTKTSATVTPEVIDLVKGSNSLSSATAESLQLMYLGTLVPGGVNGRSLNRSLSLNREVIDGEERKEIQEEIKEVPVEEPVTSKKSTKKSTK